MSNDLISHYGNELIQLENCLDGNCLWYDGSDDYAEVNVDDWAGNFHCQSMGLG